MNLKLFTALLFSTLSLFCYSQSYKVTIEISNFPNEKVILTRIHGDKVLTVDSIRSPGESFGFILPENAPVGMYRLILGKTKPSTSCSIRKTSASAPIFIILSTALRFMILKKINYTTGF